MPARISTDGAQTAIPPDLTPSEFAYMMRLPPEQAVKFLESKGEVVTSDWRSLWQDEHQRQFTISRLARADLLQDIQTQLTRSVNGDLSRKDWMRDTEELLNKAGWWGDIEVLDPATGEVLKTRFDSNRLRLIFDVNTRNAYAAGQWQRFEAGKRTNPYLRYVTKRDERVRDSHKALNNLVLPVDHPFWNTHAPPNGWRCRCALTSMSQKDYDKGLSPRGDPLNKSAPEVKYRDWYNAKTGKTERVPVGVDPGWGYNPGKVKARDAAMRTMVDDKIAKLDPALAAASVKALNQDKGAADAFAAWRADPHGNWPLAYLSATELEAINGISPVANLSSATMKKQDAAHPELTAEEYFGAQDVIDSYTIRVQDSEKTVIYIKETVTEQGGGMVVVVKTTASGQGTFITSIRRLSREEAARDKEIARLMNKKK